MPFPAELSVVPPRCLQWEREARGSAMGSSALRESWTRNSSGLPQLPQLVSAGCCDCSIWWCYLCLLLFVFTWKPHLKGHSAWSKTLLGTPAGCLNKDSLVDFYWIFGASDLMVPYLSISCYLLFHLVLPHFKLTMSESTKLTHSNWKYGYPRSLYRTTVWRSRLVAVVARSLTM